MRCADCLKKYTYTDQIGSRVSHEGHRKWGEDLVQRDFALYWKLAGIQQGQWPEPWHPSQYIHPAVTHWWCWEWWNSRTSHDLFSCPRGKSTKCFLVARPVRESLPSMWWVSVWSVHVIFFFFFVFCYDPIESLYRFRFYWASMIFCSCS